MKANEIWVVELLTTHEDMLSPYAWHIDTLDIVLKMHAQMAVEHIDVPVDERRNCLFGWTIVALANSGMDAHAKADKLRELMQRNREKKDYHNWSREPITK